MLMLVSIASYDQSSPVAPYFNWLDLRDSEALVTMPFASYDLKCLVPHFIHFDLKNSVVPFTIPSASCVANADANGLT